MLDLSQRRHKKQATKKLAEGVYDSIVVDVRWAEGYAHEEAFEITYNITDARGNTYRHREIFMNNNRNKRTIDFEDYLEENGIVELEDFKGKHEKLTFEYVEAYNGHSYFNIVGRELIT